MKRKHISLVCGLIAAACIYWTFSTPSEQWLRNRVVRLAGPTGGSCSGEQVKAPSGKNYILTAAHCLSLASDGHITVYKEDGHYIQRRVIAEDSDSDLALIEGVPHLEGMEIAKYAQSHSQVRTFTHGAALPTYKTEGELISYKLISIPTHPITTEQEETECTSKSKNSVDSLEPVPGMIFKFCSLNVWEAVTSASVVPGSSGGMVVNDDGALVGVVSATDGHFGFLVRISDVHRFIAGY